MKSSNNYFLITLLAFSPLMHASEQSSSWFKHIVGATCITTIAFGGLLSAYILKIAKKEQKDVQEIDNQFKKLNEDAKEKKLLHQSKVNINLDTHLKNQFIAINLFNQQKTAYNSKKMIFNSERYQFIKPTINPIIIQSIISADLP